MSRADIPDMRTAGIVSRGVAAIVDVLVVVTGLASAYVGWVFLRLAFAPREFEFPTPSAVFSTLGFLGLAAAYLTVCWAVSGRTAGAVLMGVMVVGRSSSRLHPLTAVVRSVAYVVLPIGLAWVAVDRDRRSIQDIVLGTRVVYNRA